MAHAYLSIGSNSGERLQFLERALTTVEGKIGKILSRSSVYESQAWGYNGQDFLNMVIKVETPLTSNQTLSVIHEIERDLGRVKLAKGYSDRTIDLDIIFFDDLIIEQSEHLVIPHPHMQHRLFVLVPLLDIAPDFIHPVLNKSIVQLRDECEDSGWIKRFDL